MDRLLQGARNLKAKGYTPEEVDAWLQTKGTSLKAVGDFAKQKEQPEQKPVDMSKIDTSWRSVAKEGLKGFGQGIEYGINKLASGATFGLTDWAKKKLGQDVEGQYKAVEDIASPISAIGTGTEIASSFPTGGGTLKLASKGVAKVATKAEKARELAKAALATKGQKLASKGLNFAEKATRYGYIPATGAVEGTASGYFATDSGEGALYGGALGGVASGAFGAVGGLAKKGFSAAERVKNITPKLENVIQSPKGGKILSKAVGANKAIAEDIHNKAPQLLEDINEKAIKQVDDVFGKQNISEKISKGKAKYSNFVEKNANKQLISLKGDTEDVVEAVGLKGLSLDQEDIFKDVWDSAFKATATREGGRFGDLKHTRKVVEYLNKMIENSKSASPINIAGKSQPLTKDLVELKTKFLNRLSELGDKSIQKANKSYAEIMKLQDAYEYGVQHSAGKFKDYGLKTKAEKDAFLRGVIDRASNNPETTNVAEKVLGQVKVLRQTDRVKADKLSSVLEKTKDTYKRLSDLDNKAFNKIEGFSQRKSKIPTTSSILDTLQDIATGRKYRRAGKYLLNPQKHPLAEPNIIPYYNFGQQGTNALIRELGREEIE